jgi:putative acetyltransferase
MSRGANRVEIRGANHHRPASSLGKNWMNQNQMEHNAGSLDRQLGGVTAMGQMNIVIGRLTTSDVEQACQLIRQTIDGYDQVKTVLAATFRRLENFEQVCNAPGSCFFVARDTSDNNKVVGGAGLGPLHGLPPSEGVGEVRDLAVDKKYRGRGLGTRLLKRCLDEARKQGYTRLYLETTADMRNAQKLFVRFGFRAVEQNAENSPPGTSNSQMPCYFLIENFGNQDVTNPKGSVSS